MAYPGDPVEVRYDMLTPARWLSATFAGKCINLPGYCALRMDSRKEEPAINKDELWLVHSSKVRPDPARLKERPT